MRMANELARLPSPQLNERLRQMQEGVVNRGGTSRGTTPGGPS